MTLDLSAKVVCGVVLDRKMLTEPYSYGFYHKGSKKLLFTNHDNQEQEYANHADLQFIELDKPDLDMLGVVLQDVSKYDKVLHKEFDLIIPDEVINYAELHGLPIVTKVVLVV